MTKLIISGYGGRMGRALRTVIAEYPEFADFSVIAGFDQLEQCERYNQKDASGDQPPVFSLDGAGTDGIPRADALVDFSNYAFVPKALRYCIDTKTPAVIATTALGEAERELLIEASKTIAVFHSANMSLGVNLTAKMARLAAPAVEDAFNIEIVEAHHNQKKDAPSGTAIMIADAINDSLREKKELIFGRHGKDEAPALSQLGIHAVRGGTLPGRHTVIFAGPDELIEITHTAYSNKVFAIGALRAAAFTAAQAPGLYDMNDLL